MGTLIGAGGVTTSVLLERRFGKVPKTYQTRIADADADTLLLWSERVLFAQRLADVFSEPPPNESAG